MGNLGFLFEIARDDLKELNVLFKNNLFIDKFDINKNKLVVFINKNNLSGNYIISNSNFKIEDSNFLFLDENNIFKHFFVFDDSMFKIGRIRVNNLRAVDFTYLTFWFEASEYKEICNLLFIRGINNDLKTEILKRIFELDVIFDKKSF